ncbi:MAG TPA: DNA alkylation repair protein [Bacteroidia bacterium]|nr:DNA alkylation repair protein [Bacteroidia bacterium]
MSEEEKKAFKLWFDRKAATRLARQISGAWPEFDAKAFVTTTTRGIDGLEFHGRVRQFSDALRRHLPGEIPLALGILQRSLPDVEVSDEAVSEGWLQWPLGQFIADHAVDELDAAFEAMIALTQRFTSEFAVRPFAEAHQDEVLARLLALTTHPSQHVRRWCSEGVRPRLPWGRRLRALVVDPAPLFPILEALKDDSSPYVRRSVANHLNDIAKDHPETVVALCGRWQEDGKAPDTRRWIVRHALRSLVKAGHPGALSLMGVAPVASLQARLLLSPRTVSIGQGVAMDLTLSHDEKSVRPVVVDYIVHYVRQRGQVGEKVFKWKNVELPPRTDICLGKVHPMRTTTIRALYPGEHVVEIQINGQRVARDSFVLMEED